MVMFTFSVLKKLDPNYQRFYKFFFKLSSLTTSSFWFEKLVKILEFNIHVTKVSDLSWFSTLFKCLNLTLNEYLSTAANNHMHYQSVNHGRDHQGFKYLREQNIVIN